MEMYYKGTVMHITAAPAEEQIYCYSNTDERQERACIGHLRGDFDTDGKGFFTSWFPHKGHFNKLPVQEAFGVELDHIVAALRENGLLKGRATMSKRMAQWASAEIKSGYSNQIALRIETDHLLLYLRCNPMRGDYNFYLYAYRKARLREALRNRDSKDER